MDGYEEMKNLWENDPEEFERRRLELIELLIAKAPAEKQIGLRRLQWEIDGICIRSKNPLQRLQNFQDFFMKRVYGESGALLKISRCCREVIDLMKGDVIAKKKASLKVVK
ncbi:MAG TPA: hypothetical protein DCX32_00655 [Candidatus Moranbacteria bacterium]|nr:MAG: hypothetical protein UW87_C0006G0022 [Candidatus Moranbacteria bacterium GW2011_GWC2_45_10]KKT95546.1 MAG: hypothetical protein UW95_C0001G0110 [Parcubacteria group bacterium GW2011_GWC1_45_14]HAV11047.1 hypothetical protein [Candidatus Moranbacteria bacterium]